MTRRSAADNAGAVVSGTRLFPGACPGTGREAPCTGSCPRHDRRVDRDGGGCVRRRVRTGGDLRSPRAVVQSHRGERRRGRRSRPTRCCVKFKLSTSAARSKVRNVGERRGADARRRERSPVQMRMGLDRGAAWRTDIQGATSRPSRQGSRALQSEAWFLSEQWAREGQGGGKGHAGRHRVHARPLDDVPRRRAADRSGGTLWFDAETGLLARVTHRRDQYAWDEQLLDWKTLAGRKRWTTSLLGDSALFPASFERMNVDSVTRDHAARRVGVRAAGVGLAPGDVAQDQRCRAAAVPVPARARGCARRSTVRRPRTSSLDTGCTMTAVDRNYATDAGITLDGRMTAEAWAARRAARGDACARCASRRAWARRRTAWTCRT